MTRRHRPLLVLDTMVVRQAHEPTLRALREKFRLSISSIAVGETLARAALGPGDRGPRPGIFYGPARRIAGYLDGCCPVIPERGELIAVVFADGIERDRLFSAAVSKLRKSWENALRSPVNQLLDAGRKTADLLDREGELVALVNRVRGEVLVKPVSWEEVFEELLPSMESSPLRHPLFNERLNLISRVNAVRAAKIATEVEGYRDLEPNDMPDVYLLACVGLPAFVATNDRRLLTDVRDTGSYQAPWVRTVEEYLAVDVDTLPRGMSWGDEARAAAKRFYDTGAAA